MFGRPISTNLKAAEKALESGDMDAAFELARPYMAGVGRIGSDPERREKQLLTRLGEALMRRGQDHLLACRFVEAFADFDRAERCGHPTAQVEEWRGRAHQAKQRHDAAEAQQRAAIAGVHQHLAQGSLVGAADARAQAPMNDTRIEALSKAIAGQNERARAALAAVAPALAEGDLVMAVMNVRKARALHSKLDGLIEAESEVFERVMREAREDFEAGRLGQARQHLKTLADVGRGRSERVDMEEALRLAAAAAGALAAGAYAQAGILLGRLARVGVAATWIEESREQLTALEMNKQALLAGPLGALVENDARTMTARRDDGFRSIAAPSAPGIVAPSAPGFAGGHAAGAVAPAHGCPGGSLPRRLMLRIDGVGSFLLLRGERIGIGRAGSRKADLELLGDLSERQAEVIRAGEDYFVVSPQGVELAGRPVSHALLQDGDRIQLGTRMRLTFRRPSHKSTTAVLELGEGVRAAAGDCRRVILWDGPILLGNTRECHIVVPSGTGGMLILERAGELFAMPMGRPQEAVHIPLGAVTGVGDLRLSANPWTGGSSVGRVIG